MGFNRAKELVPLSIRFRLRHWPPEVPGRFRPLATNKILNVEGPRKFLVSAPRRSGHHAIVNWLMNSLEGAPIDWSTQLPVALSPSESVVFVNDLQEVPDYQRHIEVRKNSEAIKRARAVFLNVEDVDIARWQDWRFTLNRPDHKIYVHRPSLDLVASRLRHNVRLTPVDETLMKRLIDNQKNLDSWTVIDFHRWLNPADDHRRAVLAELGLDSDITPNISPYGDGSSFTGKDGVPSEADLTSRHLQIDWTRQVIDLLLDREYRELLQPSEVEFLEDRSRSLRLDAHD